MIKVTKDYYILDHGEVQQAVKNYISSRIPETLDNSATFVEFNYDGETGITAKVEPSYLE